MTKILYYLFNVAAYASPGSGHSHAEEDAASSKILGILVIAIIAGLVFMFLSKKKK